MKTRVGYGSISISDGSSNNDVEAANKNKHSSRNGIIINDRRTVSSCSVRLLTIPIMILVLVFVAMVTRKGGIQLNYIINQDHPILGSSSSTSSKVHPIVPFPHVDRSSFGKNPIPASSIVDPSLFSPSLLGDAMNGGNESSSLLKVPFPTGSFWTNLVVEPTSDRLFSYPIMAYPYSFKWNPTMLQVSLPSLRRLMDSISIRDIFIADLTLTTAEDISNRQVEYFDPLSVTLRFQKGSNVGAGADDDESKSIMEDQDLDEANFWETYIIQGSPYVTAKYSNMTPIIKSLSIFQGISCLKESKTDVCDEVSNNDDMDGQSKSTILSGTQFVLQTRENLTWLVFVSSPVNLVFDQISKTTITTRE